MQIKTTKRYHHIPVRMAIIKKTKRQEITSVGNDVEKREPWCTVYGNVNWYNNPTSGLNPKEKGSGRGIGTPMFFAALFTIAKTWKQPKCPSTDEWIFLNVKFKHTHTHNTHAQWNIIQS